MIIVLAAVNFYVFHKKLTYLALYSVAIVSCSSSFGTMDDQSLYKHQRFYGVLSVKQQALFDNDGQMEIMQQCYTAVQLNTAPKGSPMLLTAIPSAITISS